MGRAAWVEKIMSRTRDTSRDELTIDELDAVCGGVSDLGKYITKAVDDAISAPAGPPDVWVGVAWVPRWW
jgi:hypothetical protein